MQITIEHLPKRKQDELRHIVKILTEECDAEMIILFGSYARGDWVEELAPDRHHYKYLSDYDIFVLVRNRKVAKRVNRRKELRELIRREIQTPITLISESVGHFNYCLSQGQYFYTDIKKEGILLFDSKQFELQEAKELSIEERRKKAEEYFNYWYNGANSFLIRFQNAFEHEDYVNAAFQLHQSTERFYSAVLLVYTDYRPKLHDIEELGKLASSHDPIFLNVFPRESEEEIRLFELLRKAYIDARYNKDYVITRDELDWLSERVERLKKLTEESCKRKIASFESIG